MNVTSVLRECAVDLLDTEPTVTVEQVVGCAYRRHGDVFQAATQQMVLQAAKTIVAKLMRDLAEDDDGGQQTLPLADLALPSAICVQTADGTYYVRTDKATWPELLAGREIRQQNVAAAQAKLDAYDESMELLRPVMEPNPSLSVLDALRIVRGEAA